MSGRIGLTEEGVSGEKDSQFLIVYDQFTHMNKRQFIFHSKLFKQFYNLVSNQIMPGPKNKMAVVF